MHVRNSVAIQGFLGVQLAVSGTAAASAVLDGGTYDMWCDVDVFIRIAEADETVIAPFRAQDVTVLNGYRIAAGNTIAVQVPEAGVIGAIAGGAGTLTFHRIA